MFGITKYDYKTKTNTIVERHSNRSEAIDAVYMYAIRYLCERDGVEKVRNSEEPGKFMFNRSEFRTGLKASLPDGHYIVRDPATHVYALEIWQKKSTTRSGWFAEYQAPAWSRIFDIDLVQIPPYFGSGANGSGAISSGSGAYPGANSPGIGIGIQILKSDIDAARSAWKALNNSLESSEIFKKIRNLLETTDSKLKVSDLQTIIPGEFRMYSKRRTPAPLMSESTIFEITPTEIVSYKTTTIKPPSTFTILGSTLPASAIIPKAPEPDRKSGKKKNIEHC